MARFVDRRTSALMRGLRVREEMLAGVASDGPGPGRSHARPRQAGSTASQCTTGLAASPLARNASATVPTGLQAGLVSMPAECVNRRCPLPSRLATKISLLPESERENRLMGSTRDTLVDRAKTTASRVKDAAVEARVGLAGPILGSLGAAAVALWAGAVDSDLLMALAFTGFFLNLFNLLPLWQLDGSRGFLSVSLMELGITDAQAGRSAFRMLAHHPDLARHVYGLLTMLSSRNKLDTRLRELIKAGQVRGRVGTIKEPDYRVKPADMFEHLIGENAHSVIFEDTGHLPMIERPNRFNRLVAEFVAGEREPEADVEGVSA